MQFHIMNNGIDSLKFGLTHYRKFLKSINNIDMDIDKRFSELKFSTIAFHNAIELFTKKILYDINELLIFSVDVSDNYIATLLHEKYIKNRRDSRMDFWIAGEVEDTTYKTIDYKRSIEILQSIFKEELSKRDYEVLVSLGKMRNAMTHLGYWDDYGWYKILTTINDSIELIIKFYSRIIKKPEKFFTGTIVKRMVILLELAEPELDEIWWASWEVYVNGIFEYFETTFTNFVQKIELVIDERINSLKSLSFEREGKKTNLIIYLVPRCDAILFIKDNIIVGVLNITDIKLDEEFNIINDSIKFYFFKKKTIYSKDLYFEWKSMGLCKEQKHLLNQLEKSYE